MAQPKQFSLRPLLQTSATTEDSSVALEGSFRIHIKRDDMAALGITADQPILLKCEATGASGVGIAWASNEPKNQGSPPFVKVSHAQNQRCGFAYQNKCTISKYLGAFILIKIITISDITARGGLKGAIDGIEDWILWAGISLAQLGAVDSSGTLEVQPWINHIKGMKRRFKIDKIVAQSSPDSENGAYIPYYFNLKNSRVEIAGCFTPIVNEDFTLPVRSVDANKSLQFEFEGLKGLDEQLKKLCQHISKINRVLNEHQRCSKYSRPSPVLIHGPSGVGKTTVLEKLGNANWNKVVRVDSSSGRKPDTALPRLFSEAFSAQPSLILLDDLDFFAGSKSDSRDFAYSLSREIHKLAGSSVQVVASVTSLSGIDQKLLDCFKIDIELPIPTSMTRLDILKHFTPKMSAELLENVADRTHAFTARDLDKLCQIAYDAADERATNLVDSAEAYQEAEITKDDFERALLLVHPSIMNEAYIEVPKVYWSDIAGSEEMKEKLWEAVNLPFEHPDAVEQANVQPSGGILLYGPPGCSKTLTAKALATESGLNFIAVKGPELISKYVGDSEQKIRDVFRKARAAAPSVIFFDEIDSIAPNRGAGHEGLNTVATLLNEMDGVEDVKRVLVLGATNRPDAIDPALLRPGRFGHTLYIGPPQTKAIEQILEMQTKKMHPAEDLGLADIARKMSNFADAYYSGADVWALCQAAAVKLARECVKRGELVGLEKRHLLEALEVSTPSLSRESVEELRKWSITGTTRR
ncbi:AAA-domain-containing protein [Tothia fuscella]|uniref:AAA-domain-containing protein n=1 Tax=Tothia fuscella TaxID=1048955 RepID=A0A9P4NKG2_9PEZI|nr:AAA-domain-containing protein [Tothia fuscella]